MCARTRCPVPLPLINYRFNLIIANKPDVVDKPNHTETHWQKAKVFKRKHRQKRTYV